MTRTAIQRRAFEKAFRSKFGVSAKVARAARVAYERKYETAKGKDVKAHPRRTAALLKPTKRKGVKGRKRAAPVVPVAPAGVSGGVLPPAVEFPEEFAGEEDNYYGGEEAPEEGEYEEV